MALLDGNPLVFLYGDGKGYAFITENIARAGVFARAPDAVGEEFRLPGYPVFLTAFQAFDAAYRYHVVSVAQLILFHGWLLLICRWIAGRHGDRGAVIVAILLSSTITWTHIPPPSTAVSCSRRRCSPARPCWRRIPSASATGT